MSPLIGIRSVATSAPSGSLVAVPVLTGAAAFGAFFGAALRRPSYSGSERGARFGPQLRRARLRFIGAGDGDRQRGRRRGLLPWVPVHRTRSRPPVAASTGVYMLTTCATRNPALVVAAGVMGTVFAAQRRASGGLLAPMLTHVTWSALMVRFLPALFRRQRNPGSSLGVHILAARDRCRFVQASARCGLSGWSAAFPPSRAARRSSSRRGGRRTCRP